MILNQNTLTKIKCARWAVLMMGVVEGRVMWPESVNKGGKLPLPPRDAFRSPGARPLVKNHGAESRDPESGQPA